MKNKLLITLFASFLCAIPALTGLNKAVSVLAEDEHTMEEVAEECGKQAPFIQERLNSSNCNFTPSKCTEHTGTARLGKVEYEFYGSPLGQAIVLGENYTENPPIKFYLTIGDDPSYNSSGSFHLINSKLQTVEGYSVNQLAYGSILVFKDELTTKYSNSTGSFKTCDFSRSFTLIGSYSMTTTNSITIPFTPDGEDLQKGVVYYFLFAREVSDEHWLFPSTKLEVEYFGISVVNNVPIGAYSLGKYAQDSLTLSGSFYKRSSDDEFNVLPTINNMNRDYNCQLTTSAYLEGQVKRSDGRYVYKGTADPVIKVSSITGQISKSQNSDDYLVPVSMNDSHINGNDLGVRIGDGAVILEKEVGNNWVRQGFYTNISTTNENKKYFEFPLSKEDFLDGMNYRITFQAQYKSVKKVFVGWWIFGYDKDVVEYRTYASQYTFTLIDSTRTKDESFSVQNSVGSTSSEIEFTPENPLLDRFYTLGDNSVSFTNITVDFQGNTQNTLYYSYNGAPGKMAVGYNGIYSFEDEGCYDFRIVSPIGDYSTRRIYILKIGNDNAYSKFFGDGFVDNSKRIYTLDDVLPTYQVGSKVHINPVPNQLGIFGKFYYLNGLEQKVIEEFNGVFEGYEKELDKCGTYFADFYTNEPSRTGQIIHYEIRFVVADQADTYRPSVNKNILYTQSKLSNYVTKVYSAKIPSLGNGNFIFVFPMNKSGYSECLNFVANREYEKVELIDEKFNYEGLTYEDTIEGKTSLNDAIYLNAEKQVDITYFDNSDPLPYLDEQHVEDIHNIYLDHDAYVVSDESTRKTLLANQPLLNGFKFAQVGEFESSSVKMVDPDGVEMDIPYDVSMDEVLTKSGLYKIIETNWAGTTEYFGNFILKDQNTAKLKLLYIYGDQFAESTVDAEHNGFIVTTAFIIENGYDKNDSQTIIKIVSESDTKYYLLSEISNLNIYNGVDSSYDIFIINRLGYMFAFNVTITESDESPFELGERLIRSDIKTTISFEKPLDRLPELPAKKDETKMSPTIIAVISVSSVAGGVGIFFLIRFIVRRRRGI